MTALPPGLRLSWCLLEEGIPPTLLIDLLDPEGMKIALAGEVTAADVRRTPAPAPARRVRSA